MKEYTEENKREFKERLKFILGKKFETATIFPLSQFETAFGHLWGHGKPETSLTDQELVFRQKWLECRTNILNNGNRQKRNSNAELDMYDIVWNRHQIVLLPRDANGQNKGNQ